MKDINLKMHHIGIIVKSIKRSIEIYKRLGYQVHHSLFYDAIQENYIALLKREDSDVLVELVQPVNSNSTVINCRYGIHHICFDAREHNNYIKFFKDNKIGKIFSKRYDTMIEKNAQVVFAMLYDGSYVEFIVNKSVDNVEGGMVS